jgi:hypothetical protein
MNKSLLNFNSWINEGTDKTQMNLSEEEIALLDNLIQRNESLGFKSEWVYGPNGVEIRPVDPGDFNLIFSTKEEIEIFKSIKVYSISNLVVNKSPALITDTDWMPDVVYDYLFLTSLRNLKKITKFPILKTSVRTLRFSVSFAESGLETLEGVSLKTDNSPINLNVGSTKIKKIKDIEGQENINFLWAEGCEDLKEIGKLADDLHRLNIINTGVRNLNNIGSQIIGILTFNDEQINSIVDLPTVRSSTIRYDHSRFSPDIIFKYHSLGYSNFVMDEDVLRTPPGERRVKLDGEFDDLINRGNRYLISAKEEIMSEKIKSLDEIDMYSKKPVEVDFYLYIKDFYGTIENYRRYKRTTERFF